MGRIDRQGEIAPFPRGDIVMTKILAFFGFVFGFVLISVALAGVSQPAITMTARANAAVACNDSSDFDDGYGIRAIDASGVCQFRND